MSKKLNLFLNTNSVKKEIATWSLEDCSEYSEHLDDEIRSYRNSLLSIIHQRSNSIIEKMNLMDTADYLRKRYNMGSGNFSPSTSILIKHLTDILKNTNANDRKKAFKDWDTTSYLVNSIRNIVPKECKPETYPALSKSKHAQSGIYLWLIGYNVTRLVAFGSFGCVWECDGKAVKVMMDKRSALEEKISAKQLAELIKEDKTGKAKKYFNYLIFQGVKSSVLESTLANMDLNKKAAIRAFNGKAEKKKKTKTINSTLRMGRQVCKALITLHKLGYSHNDVKPENLLSVNKSPDKVGKISKDGKVHKHRTQLADFGGMSKIPQSKAEEREEAGFSYTKIFSPDDITTAYCKEAVEKRDVFSLGATLLYVLIQKVSKSVGTPKKIIKLKNNEIYKNYKLKKYYGGTSKKNMYAFLDVIRKMMNQSYKSRPTLEDSLNLLKGVKYGE